MADLYQTLIFYEKTFTALMNALASLPGEQNTAVPKSLLVSIYPDTIAAYEALLLADSKKEVAMFQKNADAFADALLQGKKQEDFLILPTKTVAHMAGTNLNAMANAVHLAAKHSVVINKTLASCKIGDFEKEDLNAIDAYCHGAGKGGSPVVTSEPLSEFTVGDKTFIENYKSKITISLGAHSVMPSFSTIKTQTGEEHHVAIEYHDSYTSHEGSANRLRGVRERLELLGFECNLGKTSNGQYLKTKEIFCNNEDVSLSDIRQLATFFSLLLNGDNDSYMMSKASNWGTYQVVRDQVWEKAQELNNTHGDDTWKHISGQLDWEDTYKQWDSTLFTKNPVYNDLRELLKLRDEHHMIEEEYKIGNDHSTKFPIKVMKLILDNAKKAQAILEKNKWNNLQE